MTQSTRHDPDRLIRSFLQAGPAELADRVFDAIVDDVHRHRQQATTGLWRFPTVSRYALVGATVVVAVALVAVVIGITKPFSNIGTNGSPTPQPSHTPAANLGEPVGNLQTGTYHASKFTEPFTMIIPPEPAALAAGPALGDLWTDSKTLRIRPGHLGSDMAGAVTIHDDVPLAADLCDPSRGVISDVPSSVDAVGAWLTGSTGLTVSPGAIVAINGVQVAVDGRQARFWDIYLPTTCGTADGPAGAVVWFQPGEHHRVYAIPTGKDTIIVFTWGAGYAGQGEEHLAEINAWADQLVASMHFD